MKSALLAFVSLTVLGTARAAEDPFAAYHTAVGEQLSDMIQRASKTQPAAAHAEPQRNVPQEESRPAFEKIPASRARYLKPHAAPSYSASALKRLQRLRPELEPILQREGVPSELAAVILVESAARTDAMSPKNARGLWQLMPETARQYGLHVGRNQDGRLDVQSATHAAARYLRDLYDMFRDWPLALAAYNSGQNTVANALKETGATSFWELNSSRKLPAETRKYVPAVLAAMRLLRRDTASSTPEIAEAGFASWVYAIASPTE